MSEQQERQQDLDTALGPVRAELLAHARADAARILAAAEVSAEQALAAARETAERIRNGARSQGVADAAAMAAGDLSRARRDARGTVLAARREAYEALRSAVRAAVSGLRDDPGYPALRAALAEVARRTLGPDSQVREATGGGVIGLRDGRRVDVSLRALAERAVEACAVGLDDPPGREPAPAHSEPAPAPHNGGPG